MKRLFFLVLAVLLIAVVPAFALADGGTAAEMPILNTLIETGVEIVSAFFIALIGAFGAWLTVKLGKSAQLSSINKAQQEVILLARQTVGELQQTVVEHLKANSKDGKLTQEEIAQLGNELLDKTVAKMSSAAGTILTAAKVDVSALITGAAESWITTLKQQVDTDVQA